MSDSSSLHTENTGGGASSSSGLTENGRTTVHIAIRTAYEEDTRDQRNIQILPELPSDRFQYAVWHELSATEIRGPELRAPRVRDGPENKQKLYHDLKDENGRAIDVKKERKDYRDLKENWENVLCCNLSYQELDQTYQRENFLRILKRLKSATEVTLVENNLQDVSSLTLPECLQLNLSRNFLGSLTNVPKAPNLRHMNVSMNNILTLNGLTKLKGSQIISLNLKGNPIEFTRDYRKRVFKHLPQLKLLDGIPYLPSDDETEKEPNNHTCIVC